MEQKIQKPFAPSAYHPVLFKSYKLAKKLLKYSLYVMVLYFAWEGFMAWQ